MIAARVVVAVVLVGGAGCSAPLLDATFTSRVVQHDVCTVIGARPQVCSRDESTDDVRVRLVERDDANVWLYGIPRSGVADRAILGTKDSAGGYLFVNESVQTNAASGCALDDRLEISIAVDDTADQTKVGTDNCIALLGRENETTTSSAGCDQINTPPAETVLTANRRWEKPPDCTP